MTAIVQCGTATRAFEVRTHRGRLLTIVPTLEDASRLQDALFNRAIRSGGSIPRGLMVTDRDTGDAYHVSQNARVWRGRPQDWKSNDVPVYEP